MDFEDVHNTIGEAAPTWDKLISSLMSNPRSQRPSVKAKLVGDRERKIMPRHLYLITSVISHSRSRMKSNLFQRAAAIYLSQSGIKNRPLGTLSLFGMCSSYRERRIAT